MIAVVGDNADQPATSRTGVRAPRTASVTALRRTRVGVPHTRASVPRTASISALRNSVHVRRTCASVPRTAGTATTDQARRRGPRPVPSPPSGREARPSVQAARNPPCDSAKPASTGAAPDHVPRPTGRGARRHVPSHVYGSPQSPSQERRQTAAYADILSPTPQGGQHQDRHHRRGQ